MKNTNNDNEVKTVVVACMEIPVGSGMMTKEGRCEETAWNAMTPAQHDEMRDMVVNTMYDMYINEIKNKK